MEFTASLDAVDARTFRLTLKEPFGLVLDALAKPSSNVPFIMPARVAATPPDYEQIKETIGSGPFKFIKDEWRPGHKVVYERNADYVPRKEAPSFAAGGKQAYVDRVEWLYISRPRYGQRRVAAGRSGFTGNSLRRTSWHHWKNRKTSRS